MHEINTFYALFHQTLSRLTSDKLAVGQLRARRSSRTGRITITTDDPAIFLSFRELYGVKRHAQRPRYRRGGVGNVHRGGENRALEGDAGQNKRAKPAGCRRQRRRR